MAKKTGLMLNSGWPCWGLSVNVAQFQGIERFSGADFQLLSNPLALLGFLCKC